MNSLLLPGRSSPLGLSASIVLRRWKGGGRPGGRPAFSWREKMILRLDAKSNRKPVKFEAYGPLESIEHLIADGLIADTIDIKDPSVTDEKLQAFRTATELSSRKQISPTLLFGSQKSAVPVKQTYIKQRFSHSRIFGAKKSSSSA